MDWVGVWWYGTGLVHVVVEEGTAACCWLHVQEGAQHWEAFTGAGVFSWGRQVAQRPDVTLCGVTFMGFLAI